MASYTFCGTPEGQWLRGTDNPKPQHCCPLPAQKGEGPGSVYLCSCGTRWVVSRAGYWTRRYLPWPRRPKKPNPAKEMKRVAKALKHDLKQLEKLKA